jgi:hypothetical protein
MSKIAMKSFYVHKAWWISTEWAAHPSQPSQPTSTNQKATLAPVNLSLMHFIQNIHVSTNPFCANTLKLAIIWCHMAIMALRWLIVEKESQ